MSYEFTKMNSKLARKAKYRGPRVHNENENILRQRIGAKVLRIDVLDENEIENEIMMEDSKKMN